MTDVSRLSKNSVDWRKEDPFIPAGVLCIEADTGRQKIGAGKRWSDTPFAQEDIQYRTPRVETARYFIPTKDEWFKAGHWSESNQKYWQWGTGSDERVGAALADENGKGLCGGKGNYIAYGERSQWYPKEKIPGHDQKRAAFDVMTAGQPNEYGLYDMQGGMLEWTLGLTGTPFTQMGGNVDGDWAEQTFYQQGPGNTIRYYIYGLRIATYTNPDNLPGFKQIAAPGGVANTPFDYNTDYLGVWAIPPDLPANRNNYGNAYFLNIGSVDYDYMVCEHTVTQEEYCEFLNAVAASDPVNSTVDSLYLPFSTYYGTHAWGDMGMSRPPHGYISRHGTNGNYSYTVDPRHRNKPMGHFNPKTSARYCNWLHNGKPVGGRDETTTENGAYDLSVSQYPPRNV